MAKFGSCICVHDDHYFLKYAIEAVKPAGPVYCFVSREPWTGTAGDWESAAEVARVAGAKVLLGDWPDESEHRRAALAKMRKNGFKYCLIPDGDEILEPALLDQLSAIAKAELADRVYVHMDTYWKSTRYVIRPREQLTPAILLNLDVVEHVYIRDYSGGRTLTLGPDHGVIHHLSYAGPDCRIQRKISTWGHRHEVVADWYRRVWQSWDFNPHMRELHPTHPYAYGWAERVPVPEILKEIPTPEVEAVEVSGAWPSVSVVIPLYGGPEDIRKCLASLEVCSDLIHETIVVDDVSPDEAPAVVSEFEQVRLLQNEQNTGFAATCNKGWEASTGEVVIFLNSDTVVPRAGLIRMVESLMSSGSVAAAGAVSNNIGHRQQIATTYTSLDTMPLFAEDLANLSIEDVEVDMLVAFCLAVKRHVLKEIGAFDERFGIGQFEDNDLCYRLRRAGYRLLLCPRAFVHHTGSQSLQRRKEHPAVLLTRNQKIFRAKWERDLVTGFASALPGLGDGPITFKADRKPEVLEKRLRSLAKKAGISLCMIVKDEERVLGECLASVKGIFNQVIVVDTGSTDRTREIILEHGAELHDFPWTDSFSDARNESLRHATGKWIFWLDADDTLPLHTAEAILNAAINAPPDISGFVVPVKFTNDGIGVGTQVDHLKLFRNKPSVRFKGHIHEQIVEAVRATGGDIARINAVVHHSGYDTSEEGQAKKRERDWKLLKLDLEDDPNHTFFLFNYGMTCHFCDMHEEAIGWLRKSITNAPSGDSHVRKAYALMAVSYRHLGKLHESLLALEEGLSSVGPDPELQFQRGITLSDLGRREEALQTYLNMSTDLASHFSSIDMGIIGAKRFYNIAMIYADVGRFVEAKVWHVKAIDEGFVPSAVELMQMGLRLGDIATAEDAHRRLHSLSGPDAVWTQLALKLCEAKAQDPRRFLAAYLEERPYITEPKLALVKLLLNDGNVHAAVPHLQELERLNCAEAAYMLGVMATRSGQFQVALEHMRSAQALNPRHPETVEQVKQLEQLVAGAE